MKGLKNLIVDKYGLYLTALFQVFFVAMQPLFIINHRILPMLFCGFCISLIWTLNVKKVAFGNWSDRIAYAFGAMTGTGLGYLLSNFIVNNI